MPTVIPVKFKYTVHDLWFDPGTSGAQEGDHVICLTERGQEIGLATMDAMEVDQDRLHDTIGDATLRPIERVANEEDLNRADRLARQGEEAFPVFRKLVHKADLDMKPVGVEFLFGGGRAVCYFSAEDRVDFRQLVRELSRELHERIDMRQIGVREEAAIAGGFAHCGQELCCARFGHQFEPVSIRMAKEQDLPLNASKISGACGRLMCCLRYEFDAYRDFKQRAPKRNAVIDTPLGKAKIVEYDTPREQICLRIENGKQVRIPLAEMTTSEAACRKSEELHCPCRPDTVTRDVLERLQSPDVQMALAELDRANGVAPEEGFDSSDIFVKSKGNRRRGRRDGGDGAAEPSLQGRHARVRVRQESRSDADSPSGETRSRRRRKKADEQSSPAQGNEGSSSVQPGVRRRRRHHGGGQAIRSDASRGGSDAPRETGAPSERPKRRRHPGDHGGQQAKAQGSPQPQGQRAPRQRSGRDEARSEGGSERPRRRRRRRGGSSGNQVGPAPTGSGE